MKNGDEMRNGGADSAVRILPADGFEAAEPPPPPDEGPRRWYVPLLAIGIVLGGLTLVTGEPTDVPAVSTTRPPPLSALDAELVDVGTISTRGVLSTTAWESGDLPEDIQINDLVHLSSSFIAVGSEGPEASPHQL